MFALGVVIYEMLALRRLFQRKTDYLTFRAVMEQPIPDIRRYRPDVPDALAVVLATRARSRSAQALRDARGSSAAPCSTRSRRSAGPWTQGEISDFIRTEFAEDLRKRSAQVEAAISRSGAGHRARRCR